MSGKTQKQSSTSTATQVVPIYLSAPKITPALDLVCRVIRSSFVCDEEHHLRRVDNYFAKPPAGWDERKFFFDTLNTSIRSRGAIIVCFMFGLGGWDREFFNIHSEDLLKATEEYGYTIFTADTSAITRSNYNIRFTIFSCGLSDLTYDFKLA